MASGSANERNLIHFTGNRQLRHAFSNAILQFNPLRSSLKACCRFVDRIVQFIVIEPKLRARPHSGQCSASGVMIDRALMKWSFVRSVHRVKCGLGHIQAQRHVNRDLPAVDGFSLPCASAKKAVDMLAFNDADHPVIDHRVTTGASATHHSQWCAYRYKSLVTTSRLSLISR